MSPLMTAGARLIDAASGMSLGGSALAARVDEIASAFTLLPAGAVFTGTDATLDGALRYLGAWEAGRPVLPLDPATTGADLAQLLTRFAPALATGLTARVLGEAGALAGADHYEPTDVPELGPCLVRRPSDAHVPHPDLGLLLGTSGSTGNPKLVRLSRGGTVANAKAVASALAIGPDDVAVTALPLFYSYGISVLNSHLVAGATVVLAEGDITATAFWSALDAHGVTSLAMVPSQYEMLRRLRQRPTDHGRVRTMTVSGGRLRDETATRFHSELADAGGGLHLMYGQTEAGSRIAILPPDRLPAKVGCVGPGITGVELSVRLEDGTETVQPGQVGEVVCRGEGVMMGYAHDDRDLAAPDELSGVLRTGDLGRLDADGHLWLCGRINRIGKVFGVRVDLDAVEHSLAAEGPVAAVAGHDGVTVWIEGAEAGGHDVARTVAQRLRVHRSGVEVRYIERLPTLVNGKIDYRALEHAV